MGENYLEFKKLDELPRLPLDGIIDFTYRCNNNCRHCWIRISPDNEEKKKELSFTEIRKIVEEAKNMGCCRWHISGGEPMLRADFPEIFDYITSNSSTYSLNTNGTLITPRIAKIMKRKGSKMVALYGATPDVHDHITRNPGSFEATMRGIEYLKEAGAGFIVQLIPMRDNYHQFNDMLLLAKSLSPHYRIGLSWLYLSAWGDPEINREILRQRLMPKDMVELDKPDLSYDDCIERGAWHSHCRRKEDDYLFNSCIANKQKFHIDPYGQMNFCPFIKDSTFRYDLKEGSFTECWERYIPSLIQRVRFDEEYLKNCGTCKLRKDCYWCPGYAYLEHRRFSAKIEYLCAMAKERRRFKDECRKSHRRYYRIADITIQLNSDLPFKENTFEPKFKNFEVDNSGADTINLRHYFFLPDLNGKSLGKEVYRKPPWAIYKKADSWIYLGIFPSLEDKRLHRIAIFNHDHSRGRIYSPDANFFLKGRLGSLTLFPSDQLLLARILADKAGCYFHSCGVNFEGKGFLFVGHSGAGKSTIATMLKDKAELLCDDRVIVRRFPEGFRIYGTWSHGDIREVSANFATLKAILFLEKARENRIVAVEDRKEVIKKLLAYLIKPFVTADWWEKILSLLEKISNEIPCYRLYFDKSGKVTDLLKQL